MDADEQAICAFLKSFPGQFVSLKEICRRAGGKRRANEEPRWAVPVLNELVERNLVETDSTGHYRLIQKQPLKTSAKRWISPQFRRALQASGKNFDGVFEIEDTKCNLIKPKSAADQGLSKPVKQDSEDEVD